MTNVEKAGIMIAETELKEPALNNMVSSLLTQIDAANEKVKALNGMLVSRSESIILGSGMSNPDLIS